MNPIIAGIKERRSCRQFKPELPPRDLIDQVVDAGLYAASGMNRQSSIIVAVTNKDVLAKLAEDNRKIGGWKEGFNPFYGAPVALIVLAPADCSTGIYDGSLILDAMMLAAHSLGLASCWIHRAKEEFETQEYKDWLRSIGVEGDYIGIGHCALGYAANPLPAPPERKPNRVFHVD